MVRPSNGAEGEAWMAAWCATCVADAGAPEDGCAIMMEGLMGGHPEEWHRGPFWSPQTVMYCTKYTPRPPKQDWCVDGCPDCGEDSVEDDEGVAKCTRCGWAE